MANLSTFSMIDERVLKYKKDYSLESRGRAFGWLGLETILKLNEDEIEDTMTDDSLDRGIDAVYISGRDVHIFNFKYAEKYKNSEKNFPGNEFDKLITIMDGIYKHTVKQEQVNQLLWEKICEIWRL